jgi:hypothetical protein
MGFIKNMKSGEDPKINAVGGEGKRDVGDVFAIVKERDVSDDNVKN